MSPNVNAAPSPKGQTMSLNEIPATEQYPAIPLHEAVDAMRQYGGGFMAALGAALNKADGTNSRKIVRAFEQDIRSCHYLAHRDRY